MVFGSVHCHHRYRDPGACTVSIGTVIFRPPSFFCHLPRSLTMVTTVSTFLSRTTDLELEHDLLVPNRNSKTSAVGTLARSQTGVWGASSSSHAAPVLHHECIVLCIPPMLSLYFFSVAWCSLIHLWATLLSPAHLHSCASTCHRDRFVKLQQQKKEICDTNSRKNNTEGTCGKSPSATTPTCHVGDATRRCTERSACLPTGCDCP